MKWIQIFRDVVVVDLVCLGVHHVGHVGEVHLTCQECPLFLSRVALTWFGKIFLTFKCLKYLFCCIVTSLILLQGERRGQFLRNAKLFEFFVIFCLSIPPNQILNQYWRWFWPSLFYDHHFYFWRINRVTNNSELKCAHTLAKRRTKMRTSKFFKKAHKCAHVLAKRRTKMRTSKILAKSAQFYFTS